MPTNLPPEYFEAERRYKEARTPAEKAVTLEQLLSTIPKHKGTDRLRGDLRSKLAKLREEAVKQKKAGKGSLYNVEREGAAQICLVGFANAGKSSILKSLTNANPVIADYPMTTVMPLSGMMPFEDIQFQLVDLPPVGSETTDGWVSGILRNADALMLVADLSDDPEVQAELLLDQLRSWNIPLAARSAQHRSGDGLPRVKRGLLVGTKLDRPGAVDGLRRLRETFGETHRAVGVSNFTKENLEELKRAIFEVSEIIRVYSKEPGKEPDYRTPFTIPAGSRVLELAELIHRDFVTNLKYVCIWGSTRFAGQRVQRDYVLRDRDVVEFRL